MRISDWSSDVCSSDLVCEPRLAVGGFDIGAQFVAQLALLVDAGEDRGAPVFQLAQVCQACFEVAQLGVVEAAGDFLAVARDERHGRAFVEQRDGGFDLGGAGADLVGDGGGDLACQRGGKGLHRVRYTCGVAKPDLSLRDAGCARYMESWTGK